MTLRERSQPPQLPQLPQRPDLPDLLDFPDAPGSRRARAPLPDLPRSRPLPQRRTPEALPTRQRRSRDTRERLMAAVEVVVREAGIERATVRAIAARACVAIGTVYRRFPNKQALLLAVQRRFLARRSERARLQMRLARAYKPSVKSALAGFVNGAIIVIERDRRLLQAFAKESSADAEIHAGLTGLLDHIAGRELSAGLAIDVLLLALRALILDGPLPSEKTPVRDSLRDYLAGLVPDSARPVDWHGSGGGLGATLSTGGVASGDPSDDHGETEPTAEL
jgi:AcrR family transcriptional regulator